MAKRKGDPNDKDVIKVDSIKNRTKGRPVRKYVNKDTPATHEVQTIDLQTLLNTINDETPRTQKELLNDYKKYLNTIDWKSGFKKGEVAKYKDIWNSVCNDITDIPLISDVLRLNIDIAEKSEFIHKLIVMYGLSFDSFEFIQVKKILSNQFNRYKSLQLTSDQLANFSKLEEEITDVIMLESNASLKYAILNSKMTDKNKAFVYSRYQQLSGEDSGKLKNWIQTTLSVPTDILDLNVNLDTPCARDNYLTNIKKTLDAELYGMTHVKEQILFFINNRIGKSDTRANALALEGLPGIGKTCIVQALSKALEIPMACIPIGGAKDASILTGYGYTYEGSTAGSIVQALQELKCLNGIIFIDEIDKISKSEKGNEISKALLHITDPSQNFAYHDKYLTNQFDIDLSKIWFIYTLNDRNNIDRTLRDRIPIIHVDGYTHKEKFDIIKNHLIPNALHNLNIPTDTVEFDDSAINHVLCLVRDSNMEIIDADGRSGIRQVKYLIEYILMKINLVLSLWDPKTSYQPLLKLSFTIPNFKLPLKVTPDVINSIGVGGFNSNNTRHLSMYL